MIDLGCCNTSTQCWSKCRSTGMLPGPFLDVLSLFVTHKTCTANTNWITLLKSAVECKIFYERNV